MHTNPIASHPATGARSLLALGVIAALLTGCGGGGGSTAAPVVNQSAGGIWSGTDTLSGGQAIVGIITEAGAFHFLASGPVQYVGQLSLSGNSGSGTFDGYPQFGATFLDGSTHGQGAVTGTVQQRSTLTATTTFTTDRGATTHDSISLKYNALYERPSSLAVLAGNFTSLSNGIVFSVTANGVITGQDPNSGCVLNGTASIIDPTYNVYGISLGYASCAGAYAVLNGGQLSGVGILDNTGSPEQFVVSVSGSAGGARAAVIDVLNRT